MRFWAVGSGVRALASHARGQWFKSTTAHAVISSLYPDKELEVEWEACVIGSPTCWAKPDQLFEQLTLSIRKSFWQNHLDLGI